MRKESERKGEGLTERERKRGKKERGREGERREDEKERGEREPRASLR